jgi:hypothetical protein
MVDGNRAAVSSETDEIAYTGLASGPNWAGFRAWRQLEPEDRLALVESALKIPANDFADDLPLAL